MGFTVDHSKRERRGSPHILGTKCDGCPCMVVKDNSRYRTKPPEYWCEHLHGMVDPCRVECDYDLGGFVPWKPSRRPL